MWEIGWNPRTIIRLVIVGIPIEILGQIRQVPIQGIVAVEQGKIHFPHLHHSQTKQGQARQNACIQDAIVISPLLGIHITASRIQRSVVHVAVILMRMQCSAQTVS